ncbi:MAG: CoA transferase, partial [Rhodospirillales bacterium]|nr:CoA transferase [Rhodospirillales bacterium]
WPGNGTSLVTGGTPRYHLYPAADGRIVAVAAIEQRFWTIFCAAIGLEPALHDDVPDPQATLRRIGEIIAAAPSAHWREVFARADCCCSVVATLQEAVANPHFVARGLFARQIANAAGETMPALPVPVDPVFRAPAEEAVPPSAPGLGADTGAYVP